VRNLAIRTQESTKQIRDILGALQGQIETAAQAMHDSRSQAEHSETQAELASQALIDVHERVTAITGMSAQIARAVEEQSAACTVIFRSMEAIRQGHADNVGHSQASREAALEIGGQAEQLRTLASQFWDRRIPQAKNQ
jgi:aerotaxis receptor